MVNQGWTYRERVPGKAHGQGVLEFYALTYPHSSRATWRVRIQDGLVQLDGRPVDPDAVLAAGQELTYSRPPWREPEVSGEVDLLCEDADLVAVAKPPGLPVLPGGDYLENTLLAMVRREYRDEPAPVHRLGRGTSGVVIFARSTRARQQLSAALREGRFRRLYRALATGTDMPNAFAVRAPIGRVTYPGLGYLYAAAPEGKPARTQCRVLRRDPVRGESLLEVEIETGRPHQVRIHLAAAGHPLVGDPLYREGGQPALVPGPGRPALPGDGGFRLHAFQVAFAHPGTGRTAMVTCAPPPELDRPAGAPPYQ